MSTATWTTDHQQGAEPSSATLRPLSRRKCACGGTLGLDGECAACRARRLRGSRGQSASPPRSSALPDFGTLALDAKRKGEGDREIPYAAEHPMLEEEPEAEEQERDEEEPAAEPEGQGPAPIEPELERPAPEEPSREPEPAKEKIVFRVVDAPPVGELLKTFCPAPRAAPIRFGVRRSTAAQIAAMTPCLWGITAPDPLRVRTRVCRDGAVWRLRVTGVVSVIRTFSRLLAGEREPTVRNSTAGNFCNQVTDLDALGNCPPGPHWYLLAAVRAHEAVHVEEWKSSMGTDWPTQKAIIEGLNVPRAGATRSRTRAHRAMRASPAFAAAVQTGGANYPAFWAIPDPNTNTGAAERVLVAPRIRQLCVNARSRGWAPGGCAVCAANGIT